MVLAGVVVVAVYVWLRHATTWRTAGSACALAAAYPAWRPIVSSGMDSLALILLLPAIAGWRPSGERTSRKAGLMYLGVLSGIVLWFAFVEHDALVSLQLARSGEWITSFIALAPPNAPMRVVLIAYLVDGVLVVSAGIGAWLALRRSGANWWPTLIPLAWLAVVAPLFARAFELMASGPVTFRAAYPVLCGLASVGFWEIYAGLGKTGGHGILAVDPVREKRRARSAPAADGSP